MQFSMIKIFKQILVHAIFIYLDKSVEYHADTVRRTCTDAEQWFPYEDVKKRIWGKTNA